MIIGRRFRAPAESGNGGYSCGLLGSQLSGPAEVTLKIPPPLEQELFVQRDGDHARLFAGDTLVAEAVPAVVPLDAPPPVSFEEAGSASRQYPYFKGHPYPMCFVCGPERAEGDGLRIFPGAVEGGNIAAAPWVPEDSLADGRGLVRPEVVWASLDCPSFFGMFCFHGWSGNLVLLGRLAARIDSLPRAGERCVAVSWFRNREGRKIHTASALYGERGDLKAVGRSTWLELK